MDSPSGIQIQDQYFDCRDGMVNSGSDCSSSGGGGGGVADYAFGYDVWAKMPDSVTGRRKNFFKWLGYELEELDDYRLGRLKGDPDSEAVLANSDEGKGYLSARNSDFETRESDDHGDLNEAHVLKIRNLDDGTEFVAAEVDNNGMLSFLREVGSNKTISFEEFQRILGTSAIVQHFFRRDSSSSSSDSSGRKGRVKKGWLQKLSGITRHLERANRMYSKSYRADSKVEGGVPRIVRSHSHGKRMKELSLLQAGQEFSAHKGSILTMKFSHDGQYLASAGEDGVVRVWKVVEDDSPNRIDVEDTESPCVYLSIDQFSKLVSLNSDKFDQAMKSAKSSESTCAIIPPKVFRILEKPVHEFHGHNGDVLALSWSKNGFLLSSSVDKTARLWQVGHDECLGIYEHNNYVTCLDFNPIDEEYFISGSIDGKLRIWKVHDFRVVDWTDIKEIVTAVCYSPDGKGGIVGSMDGSCRFYQVIDNRMELGAQINLHGKKKVTGKRITGFQFCPGDVKKVMVSSADSQVRILSGTNIICKFKGVKCSGSQASASFTSDGKHVMSISEDSNVYIWNYTNQTHISKSAKNISANETFSSHNASVAIPWGGLNTKPTLEKDLEASKTVSALPDCLALGRGLFLDVVSRATATWPEEKLLDSSHTAVSPLTSRPEFKFLKNALYSPHLWGLVVVTAGWDGCIKTFLNHGLPIRF